MQQIIKQHGVKAPLHIATRIGELPNAGDMAGVETWKAIAERVDQLMDYRGGRPLSRQ
jgi:hypothetical protein